VHSVRGIGNIPANCTIADKPAEFAAAIVERLKAINEGDDQRLDGKAFKQAQIAGMDSAIARGLKKLQDVTGKAD
jgi:hypothetical protein